jgi:hypothetical protein
MNLIRSLILLIGCALLPVLGAENSILERGPNEQRISRTESVLDALGNEVVVTNAVVQLATGLNRWDDTLGSFIPASAEIEMLNGYGLILSAQHQVVLSSNANDPSGLLDLISPAGDR